MKGLLSYFVIIILLITSACKKPVAFEYKDVRNVQLTGLGFSKSTVSMDLVFYNPNSYGVNLKNVYSDIFVDSSFIGKFALDTSMHISRLTEFTVPVKMEVNVKNLLKNSVSLLFNKEVMLWAKGTTKVGKGGLYVTIPFNYQGKQKLNLF